MTENDVATLYREYGYVVFRRCVVYLGDPSAAQDAMQEVFVRALRAVANFRGEANPRTWLCRIADHLCIDLLRRRKHEPVIDSDAEATAIEAAVGDDDRESLLMVRRLLEGLEPDARRLAVLYFVDELTQDELARELGLSRRTIGKRIARVLEHARAAAAHEGSAS